MLKFHCFFFISLLFITGTSYSQIQFTQHIDKEIDQLGVNVNLPTDHFLKMYPTKEWDEPQYDLVLRSDNQQYEVRLLMDAIDKKDDFKNHLNFELQKTLWHIAKNDDHIIEIMELSTTQKKSLNVDWAMKTNFSPKEEFTIYSKARMYSLYKDSRGYLQIVYLYDDPTVIPDHPIFSF